MISPIKKTGITESDLMTYLAIVLKHLRLMILLGCLSLSFGLAYYSFSRPVYSALSLVDYEVLLRPRSAPDAQSVYNDSKDRVVLAALNSSYLKERTARRFGINASSREIDRHFIKRIRVARISDSEMLIEVAAYSHALARDWGEIMVQEYLLDREEKRIARSQMIMQTFAKEMEEIKARMDQIFDTKYDYRDTNEMTKMMIELNKMKQVPRELTLIKQKIAAMERTRGVLEKHQLDTVSKLSLFSSLEKDIYKGQNSMNIGEIFSKEGENPIVVVPQMADSVLNKPWEDLDKDRVLLQQQYELLGRTFLPGHRSMVSIRDQIDKIEHKLEAELEFASKRFEYTYSNFQNQQRELEEKMPAYEEINRRYEKNVNGYKSFDAGELAWQKMHADMEKRLNALDFGNDKEYSTLRYAGYAEPLRDKPVSPNRAKLVIYAFLMGLALAIAVPFLIEYLDSRLSDVEQIEETLRIRGLGVVPKIENEEVDGLLALSDHKPDYHLQENFRVIRTNLVINSETPTLPQVIVVTSAMPQEGKTVVSSNLAMSFALKGEKTLLIDADLRRGRLHRLFGTHNKPGVSDVLREKKPLEEAFRPTGHENLTIMTCGKHLNSASELLDSASFVKLVEELRQKYQRIIIDTPPVLGLAETSIIQRISDGILFVIWSDFTPIRNVKAAIQSLQANGAKFCGFVLNRLDFHALSNRYKYFYYAPNYYTNYKAIEAPTTYAES